MIMETSQIEISKEDGSQRLTEWKEIEERLKSKLKLEDDLPNAINTVGGIDISFYKESSKAIVCFVILSYPDLHVIVSTIERVTLTYPYIPTYLAFREAPFMVQIMENSCYQRPDLLFVDGNGILHPRLFGLACHIGVLTNIPTIGVAKNFLEIREEGLLLKDVKKLGAELNPGQATRLLGTKSGHEYGAVLRVHENSRNPIFVSPGHRISLDSAIEWTKRCSKFRIPEPIRAADHISREYIRQHPK